MCQLVYTLHEKRPDIRMQMIELKKLNIGSLRLKSLAIYVIRELDV